MPQSPLKGESAGLETSDAKGTLLDLCAGRIDQEQNLISQLSFARPQIIHFNVIFHYKPTIFGYPHLWKPPSQVCGKKKYRKDNFCGFPDLLFFCPCHRFGHVRLESKPQLQWRAINAFATWRVYVYLVCP